MPPPLEGHSKGFSYRSRVSTAATAATVVTTAKPATTTTTPVRTSQIYIVNEIADGEKSLASLKESSEEDSNSRAKGSNVQQANLANYVIDWERVPYQKYFFNRVEPVTISKFLIASMPFLLVLLF